MHAEEKMAIFGKSDDNDRPDIASAPKIGQTRPTRSKKASVIGPTLVIKGELSADEDLIIEGHIEGTIAHHKKHLTVGKQGRVMADIHASSVIVEGQLVGDIHSEGMVSLAKGADVKGNIFCSNIVMDYGARFTGKIDMGEPPKVAVVPKESVKAEPVQTEKSRTVAGQAAKASIY
jgi:cytoskeletal protein CcmA (bactofilin family)